MLVVASLVAESLTAHPLSRVGTSARTPSRAGCSASPRFPPAARRALAFTCGSPAPEAPEDGRSGGAAGRRGRDALAPQRHRGPPRGADARPAAPARGGGRPAARAWATTTASAAGSTTSGRGRSRWRRARSASSTPRSSPVPGQLRGRRAATPTAARCCAPSWRRSAPSPSSWGRRSRSGPRARGGDDVCEALKALQTTNAPFPDEEAFRVIAEDFNATGPVAPGLPLLDGYDPDGPTLFKSLSATCIASASLGQVYKGETHDGRPIAVKVQRPGALRQCLLDGSVIIVALKAIQGRCPRNSAQAADDAFWRNTLRNYLINHDTSAGTGTATSWRSSTRWRRGWSKSSTSATSRRRLEFAEQLFHRLRMSTAHTVARAWRRAARWRWSCFRAPPASPKCPPPRMRPACTTSHRLVARAPSVADAAQVLNRPRPLCG